MKVLLLLFLSLNLFTCNVIAQDDYTINVNYELQPNYTVKLPNRVDISNDVTIIQYFYKGDIYANQELHIEFNDKTFISDANRNIEVTVNQDKTIYNYTQLSNEYSQAFITLSHANLPAGNYTGSLSVEIYLANH